MATGIVTLSADTTDPRMQGAPVGSGASRARPPDATRRTSVEVAVGTVVVASTQELERPFINTVEVGEYSLFPFMPTCAIIIHIGRLAQLARARL